MEPKKVKKLVLNKEIISNLSDNRMSKVKGGGTDPMMTCPTGLATLAKCCPSVDSFQCHNCENGTGGDSNYCFTEQQGSLCNIDPNGSAYAGCCNWSWDC